MKRHIVSTWKYISLLLLVLEDYKGVGGNMLLFTIILSLQLSHSIDTNASLPLVGNHAQTQRREKNEEPNQNRHTCGK
jgi:hypothetical protein